MSALIIEVEKFVSSFLSKSIHPHFVYHNLAHTQRVVKKVIEISENAEVEKTALENLEIAAWFHDTGYVDGSAKHEEKSVEIAREFLGSKNISEERIQAITTLILATEMKYVPQNSLEEIIKDADCAHLASKNFLDIAEHSKCHPGRPNPQGDSQPGVGDGLGFHKIKSVGSFLYGATSTRLPMICSSRLRPDREPYFLKAGTLNKT